MAVTSKPTKLGMNTDELKAFTEMQTTLQLSSKNTDKALDTINSGIAAINDRLDRMDARWDERIRTVEALAIEHKVIVDANKEDIVELKKRSDNRDWVGYAISGAAAILGMFINPKP